MLTEGQLLQQLISVFRVGINTECWVLFYPKHLSPLLCECTHTSLITFMWVVFILNHQDLTYLCLGNLCMTLSCVHNSLIQALIPLTTHKQLYFNLSTNSTYIHTSGTILVRKLRCFCICKLHHTPDKYYI